MFRLITQSDTPQGCGVSELCLADGRVLLRVRDDLIQRAGLSWLSTFLRWDNPLGLEHLLGLSRRQQFHRVPFLRREAQLGERGVRLFLVRPDAACIGPVLLITRYFHPRMGCTYRNVFQ